MRLVKVDEAFAQVVSVRGRHERDPMSPSIQELRLVVLVEVNGSRSLVVYLKPGFYQVKIVHLQDLSAGVDQHSDVFPVDFFEQLVLEYMSPTGVCGKDILSVSRLEQVGQDFSICLDSLGRSC
jgi:hypothetical protein